MREASEAHPVVASSVIVAEILAIEVKQAARKDEVAALLSGVCLSWHLRRVHACHDRNPWCQLVAVIANEPIKALRKRGTGRYITDTITHPHSTPRAFSTHSLFPSTKQTWDRWLPPPASSMDHTHPKFCDVAHQYQVLIP
jgi:hypothetical protein